MRLKQKATGKKAAGEAIPPKGDISEDVQDMGATTQ
jgi:hypothetical protein